MASPGEWLARGITRWLDRFQTRHGLDKVELKPRTGNSGKVLLHVGCGSATVDHLPVTGFRTQEWDEVRLDADPSVAPDIQATMTDMSAVPDGFADAVYSSHGIEHLYWHDVPKALAEFHRVLKEDGFVAITCPDVQAAAEMIAQDRMFEPAYVSAGGTITPFDILYSFRPFVEANPQWMSHHCGFTLTTLNQVVQAAGFCSTIGFRRIGAFDLWLLACKSKRSEEALQELAANYLCPRA